jgi:hypothetical protein
MRIPLGRNTLSNAGGRCRTERIHQKVGSSNLFGRAHLPLKLIVTIRAKLCNRCQGHATAGIGLSEYGQIRQVY